MCAEEEGKPEHVEWVFLCCCYHKIETFRSVARSLVGFVQTVRPLLLENHLLETHFFRTDFGLNYFWKTFKVKKWILLILLDNIFAKTCQICIETSDAIHKYVLFNSNVKLDHFETDVGRTKLR
jgi:hypothetical protein